MRLILLGAGGHAKVLLALARAAGHNVIGVCDPSLFRQGVREWRGVSVLGDDSALAAIDPNAVGVVNGIGQRVGDPFRKAIFLDLKAKGFRFPALVHPAAWIDPSACLEEGAQIMAGVVVQADAVIGQNVIINTRASVDHDCVLGAHVHVAPGATLCGNVVVGEGAFIASGATAIQGLRIGADAVVGAGAVVVRDLPAGCTQLGPAPRAMRRPFETTEDGLE